MTGKETKEVKTISLSLAVAIGGPIISGLFMWVMAGILIPKQIAQEIAQSVEVRITQERELHLAIHKQIEAEIEDLSLRSESTKLEIKELTQRYNAHAENGR